MLKTAILLGTWLALLSPVAKAQTAAVDSLLAKAARWDYGQDRAVVNAIAEAVQRAQGPAVHELETRFIAFLKSDATNASRAFICRQLGIIGSEASVPALAVMVENPATSDMARTALEQIPGQAVDRALRAALGKTTGKTRIGIVNTLGARRDAASVRMLAPLALAPDPATATAALSALANIADPAALRSLAQLSAADGAAHTPAAEAYLRAADNSVERGNKAPALPIYRKLYGPGETPMVRAAALHGLIAIDPRVVPTLLEALSGNDPRLQAIAVRALARSSVRQLLAEMPKLPETARIRVLGTMAEQRENAALPVVATSLKDPNKNVRLAALEAAGAFGDVSLLLAVAEIAAAGDESESAIARDSLASMPGKAIDARIVESLPAAEPKLKVELIRAAGARAAAESAPILLRLARDPNADVRRESLRAMRDTASGAEIAGLAAVVATPFNPADRAEAARTLTAALRRSEAVRVQDVLTACSSSADPAARAALLGTLGPTGTPQALPVLRAALKDENAEVKRAAILALTDWPDGAPIADMFETARAASNPVHQILALRGAIKLIDLPAAGRSDADSVRLLAEAMSLAKQTEEKRAVLALLPKYLIQESLELARASLNDPQVASEAKSAATRLERALRR